MSSVVRLSHYRHVARSVAQRDLPLDIGAGDSDLVPIAVVLWFAAVARVILAVLHHETFGAEATFALFCAALLPWFVYRARSRHDTVAK